MPRLESTQPVVARSQIQTSRSRTQVARAFDAFRFHGVGVLLYPRVCIFGEAARGGQEEPTMSGALREEPLRQLEAERDRCAHEIGVVIGTIRGTALGK